MEFTDEFSRVATNASNAFAQLREQLREASRLKGTPEPGDLIGGRYIIERELGRGGFGSVFEVRHSMLDRRFAMKLLNPRIAADPDWVARFREEARATSLIGHESIVYVTDFGEDDDWGSYFVMEYLEGAPLEDLIAEKGPQPLERVLRFTRAAAGALGAVHELGIVHCDLKPSNVFVIERTRQPELFKFLDFGTSTVVMNAVETEALYGTPRYMAPEQSVGRELTPRSDQFSLATIIYEMVTGRTPWEITTWLQATPEARRARPPEPPSASGNCPPAWDEIILTGLTIEPDSRWPSVEEFADRLQATADVDWAPSVDPLDVRAPERGSDEPRFARTMTAPSVRIVQQQVDDAPDIAIEDDSATGQPKVRVGFQNRDRFVREWRRNLSVGGIFVLTEQLLPLRSLVTVELVFEPSGRHCILDASVVGHETRPSAGRGFGLAIAPGSRRALDEFAEDVVGGSISPDSKLRLGRTAGPEDDLTPGEWFLLSRVEGDISVARLRSMCAGLPFDVDDILPKLIERGLLATDQRASDGASDAGDAGDASASVPVGPSLPMPSRDVKGVLERVDFHRHQGNYLGASQVLRRAIEAAPRVAEFHYRLALLHVEFDTTHKRAIGPARRAAELAPDQDEYRELLDSLT